MRCASFSFSLALLLFATAPLRASTIIVDASGGPGSQFTDIPPAILAAAPDDLILVRAGTYSAFTVDKRLTILGQGNVLSARITAQNTIAAQRIVLVNLRANRIDVTNCAAPVILQDVRSFGTFNVSSSSDVRALRATVLPANTVPGAFDAIRCVQSRLELVSCTAFGATALDNTHLDGGIGVTSGAGAFVHAALTNVRGGGGAAQLVLNGFGGNGGIGVLATDAGVARVDGGGVATVEAGPPGIAWAYPTDCSHDGQSLSPLAASFWIPGTAVEWSLTTLVTHSWWYGTGCIEMHPAPTSLGCTERVPPGATLELVGDALAGSPITFTVRGEPGSLVTWWLGRQAIVVPDPAADLALLAPRARLIALGALPSGTGATDLTFSIQLPSTIPVGAVFVCQAECLSPTTGFIRRTNSIPIVVR